MIQLCDMSNATNSPGLSNFEYACNKMHLFSTKFWTENEHKDVIPGVKWGNYCQLYTPAFWKYLYIEYQPTGKENTHRVGGSIIEEVIACLLGGYGIPSELGMVAYRKLKNEGLLKPGTAFHEIHAVLSAPLETSDGSVKRYRFSNQKSKFIFNFLQREDLQEIPVDGDLKLRNWLLTVQGVGLKTASWITRNWLQSENVAILDIHILRAGKITGFFKHMDVTKHYFTLERDFIDFCKALDARPSNMDALIWEYMKKTNTLALRLL